VSVFSESSSGTTPNCEYLIHKSHIVIHSLFTLGLTAERHFCSIFKHKSFGSVSPIEEGFAYAARTALFDGGQKKPKSGYRNRKLSELLLRGLPRADLGAGTRLHQSQCEHVKRCKKRDHQQDPSRLSVDEAHERLRVRQKLRLNPISFVPKIGQD